MATYRQNIAADLVKLVEEHSPCQYVYEDGHICGGIHYKPVNREQHGVDLQCCECGRLVEVKASHCIEVPAPDDPDQGPRRKQIPGGSHAVSTRQQEQRHHVDMHVVEYDAVNARIMVARAETQPDHFRTPRRIKTGIREGHILVDLNIGCLASRDFPVVARIPLPLRVQTRVRQHQHRRDNY